MGKLKYNKDTIKERIIKEMPESDIEIIEYSGIVKPIKIKCNKCENILSYNTADKIIDRGRRGLKNACNICEDTKSYRKRVQQVNKLKELLETTPNIILLTEDIKRVKNKIDFKCLKCGNVFQRNIYEFFKTQKCPFCEGNISKYNLELFQKKMEAKKILDYEVVGDFKNSETPILFKHKKCGFIWKASPSNILAGHGCPKCKLSKGETKIAQILDELEIKYYTQYRFKNTEISNMPFDFYVLYKNKEYCIEFQGEQHFKPIDHFGGEEKFIIQKERDIKKKNFCNKRNIILIEIPYYSIDDIENILKFWFNDQSKDVVSSDTKNKPSKDEDIV